MRQIALLPGDGPSLPRVSELGFGCAAIGGRVSRAQSMDAMARAFDHGITLFDTARSYGYGESEEIVGDFTRGRRDRIVVCTKFGILPGAKGGWKQRLKPIARSILKIAPGLRSAVRRQVGDQFVPGQFSVENLRTSFETSLRALKTDYVDMLLLHAAPAGVIDQDDLMQVLALLVEQGKVRVAGISADHPVILDYFLRRPAILKTAQFALNLNAMAFVEQTRLHGDLLLVANHPFGGARGVAAARTSIDAARVDEHLPPSLREKLDQADPQLAPEVVLNCILRGTGVSAAIPAMMQARHIDSNLDAVEQCRFSDEELSLLRSFFAANA